MFRFLSVVFGLCVALGPVKADLPVRIYTHGEGPFAYKHEDGTITGSAVDILNCTFDKMGMNYTLSTAPMIRVGRLSESGALDMWFPAYYWDEHDKRIY